MTNFRIEYSHPWLLLLLIPAALLTLIPYFRAAKKYRRTRNRILSMVFHMTAMVLAINLLAGVNFAYEIPNEENEVIILVDTSESNAEAAQKEAKDEFVGTVIGICDNQYRLGIVKFGFDQKYVVEISDNTKDAYEKYLESEDPDTSATDIASALKYASTLFKNPKTAKIVLISDGVETDSSAMSVIKGISGSGIKVDTVHFPNEKHDEIQIVDVKLPLDDIAIGEEFLAELSLKGNIDAEQQIKLTVLDNEKEIGSTEFFMNGKESKVQVALAIEERGMHEFTFRIENAADTVKKNNEYHTFVNIEKFENILIVERRKDDARVLKELLGSKYKVISLSVQEDFAAIPTTPEEMVDYEQIILANIAYSDMPAGFEAALNEYVYNLGGGLFTIGGENDYVGGSQVPHAYNRNDIANSTYFKQMLPINAIDYTPPIAVMIVIDTSASMSGGKLPAAIDGAKECLNKLNDRDFCGVISFSTRSQEEIQVLPASEREKLLTIIEGVGGEDGDGNSGGTIFSDAIMRAGNALSVIDNVERKHIIMVSDGDPGDPYETYLPYIEENVKKGITMSVITVGTLTVGNGPKMDDTAKAGGGKHYNVKEGEFDNITQQMLADLAITAVAEIEYGKEFTLSIKDSTRVVNGIEENAIPPLSGYYGTVLKNGAVAPLVNKYVPIYAEWQYGEGKVGSFMCDLNGIWSDKFVNDPVGQGIILNIIDSIFPLEDVRINDIECVIKNDNYTNQLGIYGAGESDKVEVTVTPVSDSLANVLEDGVTVSTVEEGRRYKFIIKDAGLYRIRIKRFDESGVLLSDRTLYKTFSYSEEYNYFTERAPLGKELLTLIAKDGKGMEIEDPASVFESFSKTLAKEFDPRVLFLILCIICVLLDIAVRKFKFKWIHELVREHKQRKADKV